MTEGRFPMTTERLTLRFLREDDIAHLTAYRNDPQVAALQDWDLPYSEERARTLVAAHADRTDFAAGRGNQIGIELDGQLVGDVYVGLDDHLGVADIGFSLTAAAQGRGIAHEATSALIADLIERIGVHRAVAELSKDNLASMRLLERLGMTFECLTAQSLWWRGAWDDNLYYSMTAGQWRAWRDRPRTPPAEVRLVPITGDNRRTYEQVRTHHSQDRFCTGVHGSYADALFPDHRHGVPLIPVLRGIEADGEPVGFLMYSAAAPYLWRFLVDRRHQGRGIGRVALTVWLELMRAAGHRVIETSWAPGKGSPEPFFASMGFVPTGEFDDGATIARITL